MISIFTEYVLKSSLTLLPDVGETLSTSAVVASGDSVNSMGASPTRTSACGANSMFGPPPTNSNVIESVFLGSGTCTCITPGA